MNIQLVTYKIIGEKPLIQSNPHQMWKAPELDEEGKLKKAERKAGLRGTDSQDFATAKAQLYVNDDGLCYHPAKGFWDNLLMACAGRTLGGTSALTIITRSVALVEDEFLLYDPTTLDKKNLTSLKPDGVEEGLVKWQIDYRRVVNHNKEKQEGGVSTVAIRPKWKVWGGLLTLEVDLDFFEWPKDNPTLAGALDGLTGLLNVGGHYFGVAVCRMRIKAIVKQQPVWSGLGMGKYSAELMST